MLSLSADRTRIRESEIDALLVRRLQDDPAFRGKLVEAVATQAGEAFAVFAVTASVQQPHVGASGTIDVLVRFTDAAGQGRLTLLIEDKINARFTPNQPHRYVSSATAMTLPGCPALSVLCAPGRYLASSRLASHFHIRIPLEALASWLVGTDRALLEAIIDQYDAPPEAMPVPAVADFHQGYREAAATYFPELVVKRSPNSEGERPGGSFTIYFETRKTLPSYPFLPTLRFSHQCQDKQFRPSVKIMLGDWTRHAARIAVLASADLEGTGFYLRPAGASLAIVHDTPGMDNQKPVSNQMDAVLQGLQAAAKLRAWVWGNEHVLKRWAVAIQ